MSSPFNPMETQLPYGLPVLDSWRAAEQRYGDRLKELGIERGIPIAADDPRCQAFDDAWQCLQSELDEIRALLPGLGPTHSSRCDLSGR